MQLEVLEHAILFIYLFIPICFLFHLITSFLTVDIIKKKMRQITKFNVQLRFNFICNPKNSLVSIYFTSNYKKKLYKTALIIWLFFYKIVFERYLDLLVL